MDRLGQKIVRLDDLLWHLSNVGVGVAVFVATLLYAPPGSYSLNVVVFSIDPFYVLVPLSVVYTVWTGIDFWRWFSGSDSQ
ncbi:hypothetical protein [Salinibaculum salinum]|uniref:hypothetical protein n=1 Tax=Salinibaculum salinum TaxID=3131996 RepID=UPI0030EF4C45